MSAKRIVADMGRVNDTDTAGQLESPAPWRIADTMSAKAKSIEELRSVADDISRSLGDLSAEQLNWKPGEKRWSVAQCLDHLITTHQLYFPLFEKLSADEARPSFWEKASPLSGFFGRFLIRSLDPKNTKKMKTTAKAFPSSSAIDGAPIGHDQVCADIRG